MIFGSFLAGIILFMISVVIVVYYQGPMDPEYNAFLFIFAPISAIALMMLGYRLFMGRVKQGREKADQLWQKMDAYRGATVIRMLLLDGAAFIQLIAYVMSADKVFLILCLVICTMFMLYRPRLESFIKDMELNETEKQVMRDHAA